MFKKYIIVMTFFLFIINNLLLNTVFSSYENIKLNNKIMNPSTNVINFYIENKSDLQTISYIKKYPNISIVKDSIYINAYKGQAVYFNDFNYDIPIIEGRFFKEEDFDDNINKIVIGKDMRHLIVSLDGKKYVKFNGIKYEVIGIMGLENSVSTIDKCFYINLNSYLGKYNENIVKESFKIYSIGNFDTNLLNSIPNIINNYSSENINSLSKNIYNNIYFIVLYFLINFYIVISIFFVSLSYFKDIKNEISCNRNVNQDMDYKFFKHYFIICLKVFLISIPVSVIIIKSKIFLAVLGDRIFIFSFIISFIFTSTLEMLILFIIKRYYIISNNKGGLNSIESKIS